MQNALLVERALTLIPDAEELLPFVDAVVGTSRPDTSRAWSRSGVYATLGKRIVDTAQLRDRLPHLVDRSRERIEQLYSLVLEALEEQQAGNPAQAARVLVRVGEQEEADRRLAKAEQIYQAALEIARDLRDKGPQILALRRLGRASRIAGRLDDAWTWYHQSHSLAVDAGDPEGQAIACQGLGNLCSDHGSRQEARQWYLRGLSVAEELDSPELIWPFYTNLTVVAGHERRLEEADALLAQARRHIQRAGGGEGMSFWYNNAGLLLLERENAAGAESAFRDGLEQTQSAFWDMTLRINLGHSLIPQDRLLEATDEARCAEEIAIFQRFVSDLVNVYLLLGAIARAEYDVDGFIFYEQALEVCRERTLPRIKEAEVYHGYGQLYAVCGRAGEAREYLEHARAIYQTLGLRYELANLEAELGAIDG